MAKFKVVITDYIFDNLDTERSILKECDSELIALQCKSVEELIPFTMDADAILNTYLGGLDEHFFSTLKKCKVVVRYGIGIDTIDVSAATQHGVMVANVPDYCIEEVSDHAVACVLALVRKLTFSDRCVRQGNWDLGYLKPIHRLKGLVVGIVGMGRIGRRSSHKISSFGVSLIFHDPYVETDIVSDGFHARRVTLEELVAESDIILIHAPATPETYHLFNKELFSQMKRKPVIINCARGTLVDTDALIEALAEGQVSGAALDVIEGVPPFPPDNPLCQFDNVIITPHSAWYSEEAIVNLQRLAVEEVARVLKGEQPKSLVNPEVLSDTRHN